MDKWELPSDWRQTPIDESISSAGLISDGDWIESKDQDQNGSVRLIQLADIGDGKFLDKSSRFMTPEKAKALSCTYLEKNDVLVARMPDPLGRATIFPGVSNNAVTVVDICLIRVGNASAISHLLLKHWINSPQMRSLIAQNASGTTRKRITRKKLEKFAIPIPPLAEQKVIAEKLDKLLAKVDSIKARLDAVPDTLKRFRQSVLAAAVSGKLTEEWRSTVKLIRTDIEPNKKLPNLTEKDYYSESIDSWSWCRLGSVSDLINGDRGKNYPNKSEYVEDGIPFINTGHIESDGTLSHQRMNFISQAKYDSLGGGKTSPTDLVYCLRGATMGKTARVNYEVGAIASSLVIVRTAKVLNREFAYFFLISPEAKKLIKSFDNGSAQPNLSAKSLASYPIQIPSLKEQTEIIRRVEKLFAYADKVEAEANAAQERVNKLTQSILAKAFRGELTQRWREQNPELISGENSAEMLLEKIKTERERLKPVKTSKKRAMAK